MYYIDSSLALSSCHYVLRPRREPRSASNANKPASSWPPKQGRKKCSKLAAIEGPRQYVTMMNGMSLHPFPKGAPVGRQISIRGHGSGSVDAVVLTSVLGLHWKVTFLRMAFVCLCCCRASAALRMHLSGIAHRLELGAMLVDHGS